MAVILVAVFTLTTHARVFQRWGGRAEAGRALEALGATQAYSAPVVFNGGRGSLAVYGLDLPLGAALQRAGKALNATFHVSGEVSMVVKTLESSSGRLHLIALALPDVTRTLFFLVTQSRSEAERSAAPPATAELPGVPAFPGSTPLFVATDEKARADLAVSSTTAPGAAVADFYSRRLTAAGWVPALPGGLQGVYLKGRRICCVQAAERAGQTHVAVLHKELSSKPDP